MVVESRYWGTVVRSCNQSKSWPPAALPWPYCVFETERSQIDASRHRYISAWPSVKDRAPHFP